jgi:DNA polymerase IV
MGALTPLAQPLSIDEAVLDLFGTEALHGAPPAAVLARFARAAEQNIGLTVSIGLSANRLMAKIAAGRGKPRGFTVIDAEEAAALLAPEPVRLLPGVDAALAKKLESMGITRLGQLQSLPPRDPLRKLGDDGPCLIQRALGQDPRRVDSSRKARTVSNEITFDRDLSDIRKLERHLWRLCKKLATRLRRHELAAAGIVLKLKASQFALRTRAARLSSPTMLPDRLFALARSLLAREVSGKAFRLIGIGASPLVLGAMADPADLADPSMPRRVAAQAAVDILRGRFGNAAISRAVH